MQFGVLGPLCVVRENTAEIERPAHRRLLSILLLDAGQRVSRDVLIDRFWDGSPPSSARGALQTHVYQLRKLLQPELIRTEGYGYRLKIDGHVIDAREFSALALEATESVAIRDWEQALAAAGAALELWRGEPYPELAEDHFAAPERTRLHEARLGLEDVRAEALLELGRHDAAIPGLEALVVENPLRERLWEHLILARHRSGRTAEALRAFGHAAESLAEIGLEPGERLRHLEERVLLQDPSLGLRTSRHNLPTYITRFIGRDEELAEVSKLLADSRLVTLTGVGGTGKTRLAVEVVSGLIDVPNGSWFVELGDLGESSLVPGAVAAAIGLRPHTEDVLGVLTTAIADQRLLIVLDTCEHVLAGANELAAKLLAACPDVKILATSREPLAISGEVVYEVAPLGRPDGSDDPGRLRDYDSVRLFEDRASLVSPGFEIEAGNAAAVKGICASADGIPLAIEIAAGQVRSVGLERIAERPHDHLGLPKEGHGPTPERQRTIEATVAWSYDLLSDEERVVFTRLAVFDGGFELDLAGRICTDKEIDTGAVESAIVGLVDKSLVAVRDSDTGRRYRMLDPVRHFASKLLQQSGESEFVGHAHMNAYVELADTFRNDWRTPKQMRVARRFAEELGNFRAALRWSETQSPISQLRLTGDLLPLWVHAGLLFEGFSWFDRAPTSDRGLPPDLRTRVLVEAIVPLISFDPDIGLEAALQARDLSRKSQLANIHLAEAMAWAEWVRWYRDSDFTAPTHEPVELAVASGDPWGLARVKMIIGLVEGEMGLDSGVELLAESVASFHELGDRISEAWALWWLADAALHVGRLEESLGWAERAEGLAIATASKTVETHVVALRGDVLRLMGDHERAQPIYERGLDELKDQGDLWCLSLRGSELASMLVASDRPRAIELLEESASIARRISCIPVILRCAVDVARLATHEGEFELAIELFAPYDLWIRARAARIESTDAFRLEALESAREPEYSVAVDSVDPEVRDKAWARGSEMSVDRVDTRIKAWLARKRSVISTRAS